MGLVKITIFQKSLPDGFGPAVQKKLAGLKSDFLLFPEYLFADSSVKDHKSGFEKSAAALDWMLKLSDSYKGIIIGGSILLRENGKVYNACPVIADSKVVDYYRKRNLTTNEKGQIEPGTEAGAFILGGFRFSVLICADVLKPAYFDEIAGMGIQLVFCVMTSPFKEETVEEKRKRDDELFCKPAAKNGMVIAKCCGAGTIFGNKLQGRSLIAAPNGISWRVSPGEEDKEILKTVIVQAASA